jgi:hypothetical protein
MMPPKVLYFLGALCGVQGLVMLVWNPGPNRWIGVRLPWTFADREIWDKSWRLAALLLLAMGVGAFVSFPAFIVATALLTAGCLGYPWQLYRRKYGTSRYWKDQGCKAYHPVARCTHCGHMQNLPSERDVPAARCEACGLLCRG